MLGSRLRQRPTLSQLVFVFLTEDLAPAEGGGGRGVTRLLSARITAAGRGSSHQSLMSMDYQDKLP